MQFLITAIVVSLLCFICVSVGYIGQRSNWDRTQARVTVERVTGLFWGTYKVPRSNRLGPFGLIYFGPVGPNAGPDVTYVEAWVGAAGFEVTVLGRSIFLARL